MPTLTMTKGLPGSGKSTWAKAQVIASNGRAKRVNKDDLRDMIDAGSWSKQNEKTIVAARDLLVHLFLQEGKDVIVDDTNLPPKHEKDLREIAQHFDAKFEIEDFTGVPLLTCLERNLGRLKQVSPRVIKTMYNTFLRKKGDVAQYQKPEYNPDLPDCIIVDIDGTLAHMAGRSPYDYSKVSTDVVDENVAEIVRRYAFRDIMTEIPSTYIIIVSGRDSDCKPETVQWLQDNHIPYDEIYMRDSNRVDEKGNKLDDTVIKQDIYEEWIKPRFNVRFVLDDRDRVVKMWRRVGLKVLQVAEGDF